MYAIIKTGGKQYRVQKGDVIDVELVEGEEGKEIQLGEVLFLHDGKEAKTGAPTVVGAHVTGRIVGTVGGPKITSIKYKPSHNQWKKFGHRQKYSRVEITEVGSEKKHSEKKHSEKKHTEHDHSEEHHSEKKHAHRVHAEEKHHEEKTEEKSEKKPAKKSVKKTEKK